MKLIVVRHGETSENVKGILQGSLDVSLNKTGRQQAKAIGHRLKSEKIDVVFSSDLKRAKQTAKEIARFHKVPVHYVKEIRERDGGIFEGRPFTLLKLAADKSGVPFEHYKPKNGESLTEVQKRIQRFMQKVSTKYKGKTVLLVTHGGVTRALASLYLEMPLKRLIRIPTYNTGLLILSVNKSKARKIKDEMFIWNKRVFS
jgi:broad specificity phosphatase PhoE